MAEPEPPPSLIPLSRYERPAAPAEDVARDLWKKVRRFFDQSSEPGPFIADDQLRRSTSGLLDDLVTPPPCGPACVQINESLDEWMAETGSRRGVRAVVLPPCIEFDPMTEWASSNGLRTLRPPDRARLIAADQSPGDPCDSDLLAKVDGPVVIPRLELWFLRHRDGLRSLRRLLTAIADTNADVAIGCDSWAWAYLCRAEGVDQLAGEPATTRPFSGPELAAWFGKLLDNHGNGRIDFRLSSNGETIDPTSTDGASAGFFEQLASRSLGIPWVAWHLWRRCIRSSADPEDTSEPDIEATIKGSLWLTPIEGIAVPASVSSEGLLVLQSLLLHGGLLESILQTTLPQPASGGTLNGLKRAGLIGNVDGRLVCRAAAYPEIRDRLAAAGVPMGVI